MSAVGQILVQVEGLVKALLSERDDEQDRQLADLEARVTKLEERVSPAAMKTGTARAGAARAKGAASAPSGN